MFSWKALEVSKSFASMYNKSSSIIIFHSTFKNLLQLNFTILRRCCKYFASMYVI